MAILIVADTAEELPDELRKTAKQDASGKVTATLPDGWGVENAVALKRALSEERTTRKKLEESVKAFADAGLGADSAVEASAALEKFRSGGLKSAKEIEDYRASLEAKYQGETKKVMDKLAKRDAQLRKKLIDAAATEAISKNGGARGMRALLPLVHAAARVDEDENGELRVTLHNEAGQPLITKKSGSNDPMGFDEFVQSMREADDLKPLFDAKPAGGSGGGSQPGGSWKPVGPDRSTLSPQELLHASNEEAAATIGRR